VTAAYSSEAHVSATSQQLYEQTLVIRSQIGDEAAFQKLLQLYGPRLLGFARKMMQKSPDEAEDLLQEIWLSIFRGLPSLMDVGKFRPWAFRIARDRVYREYRRRRLPVAPIDDARVEELPETDELNSAANAEELHQGLDVLSPQHREVLLLRFFEEMSYEEIARVTGSTLGTVRSRIHYGKRALRNALDGKAL